MDDKFRMTFEGDDHDLISKIDSVTAKLNRTRQLNSKWSQERASLARNERKEAFNALSIEERKLKLSQKQLEIEKNISRAKSQGNQNRVNALSLSLARNNASIRGLGGATGSVTGTMALAAIRGGPFAIALAGFAALGKSALHFADETSDAAEQLGVTTDQIIQITRAAGYAGASPRKVFGNLSTLSAVRSAALGGDENAKALFAKYGIDPSKGNTIELAQAISESMGPAGMQMGDRKSMGAFFGGKPEGILSALRQLPEIDSVLSGKSKRLDDANSKIEQFTNSAKDSIAIFFGSIIQLNDYVTSKMGEFRRQHPMLARAFGISGKPDDENLKTSWADKRRAEDGFNRSNISDKSYDTFKRTPVPQADALARMGIYIGGGPNSGQAFMKQELAELRAIKEATRSQVTALQKAL